MTRRLALLLIFAVRSWACVCSGWPSVKQAWRDAPAVFLGTVEIADPDGDDRELMFQEQFVRIHVDEAFKGVSAGQTIALHQGATDCDAKFRTGQRAVFYLYRGTGGGWSVRWCTYALGSAEPAGDDLLFLRGLPKSAIGTRLSGEVEYYQESPTESFKRVAGLPNVKVKISGPRGLTQEAKTNVAGVFEVFGLPPGTYSVGIEVPSGLAIDFPVVTGSAPVRGDEAAVILKADGGASVGFVLEDDTRLSGRMLDAKGAPIKNVCIDLEPLEGRGENGARFFDCSKGDGSFRMRMMPPGKYRLVARDEVRLDGLKSESTLYYPGVRNREGSKVVSVEAGRYIKHLDIRLPSDEKRYRIAGRLQFADGAPVPGAKVTFTSPQHGYSEETETNADGSFGLSAVAGMAGQLSGQFVVFEQMLRSCPQLKVGRLRGGMFRLMDANPVPLSIDSDREHLTLELPSQSCKDWPPRRN